MVTTLADKRRTAQEASAAVRRQKKALAVIVPITSLFPALKSNGLHTPITARIIPVEGLSEAQAREWLDLWHGLLGESG